MKLGVSVKNRDYDSGIIKNKLSEFSSSKSISFVNPNFLSISTL
jgi:hypothetical protein